MDNDDLPGRVRAERKRRGWTQQQTADLAGVSLRAYQMFEGRKAKPQDENLRAILAALDVSPDSDETAAATRASWPPDLQVFLDMMGAYLGAMPDDRRLQVIHDLTRQVFTVNRNG